MPSQYMSQRLARVPFREPPPSTASLADEFLADIDAFRANTAETVEQECQTWQDNATRALSRAATKEAKAYVWTQFAKCQRSQEEPLLYMAAYTWLATNIAHAPKRASLLDWQTDTPNTLSVLLAAAACLPDPAAVNRLKTWLDLRVLEVEKNLPVHAIRVQEDEYGYGFYDRSEQGYDNLVIWEHILPRLLPYVSLARTDFSRVPYLPFAFEYSFVEHLLPKLPEVARTWMLSNALFAGDMVVQNGNRVEQTNTMKGLSKLVCGLTNTEEKAFAVWDLVQRQSNDESAARILQEHLPDVHALLQGLGLLECESILEALHHRWSQSDPEMALPIPEDAIPMDQWTNTP